MGSCLTAWTSVSTRLLESKVRGIVDSRNESGIGYSSISLSGCNKDEIIKKINDSYHDLVNMTMADSTMHIVAVVPLYEKDSAKTITVLYEACSDVTHSISLHILGLCGELERLFDIKENDEAPNNQCEAMAKLADIGKNSSFGCSFSLIDEFASNGAPIGFGIDSLARFIALIQIALMQDYYAIFSPALLAAYEGKNLSIGVSSLAFDREAATRQLLGLGFLSALEKAGINNEEVDIQKATHEAEKLLYGISSRYRNLYENSIRPLFRDGMEENQVVSLATPIIENDLDQLKEKLLELKHDDNLTYPEKEAVLAMILGRDNENLRGAQYEHEILLLDDACTESIDLYVNTFNEFCENKSLLPTRGDFPFLRVPDTYKNDEKLAAQKNSQALNPLSEIKRLKHEILNITSFIRDKNSELDDLRNSEKSRESAEDIKRHWKKPQGNLGDVEYKEEPLQEKYIPNPSLKVKDTVDLRKFFSPVKNQHDVGACTSFAVTSMYEAMMNRNGNDDNNVMSPAFLYYYSNVEKGRPSGGSNFFEQFEVLGRHGICFNDYYEYNPDKLLDPPSESAINDASTHKLLEAKQIPITNDNDKALALEANHKIFTSALSEGYPIGISLKVYDNLGKDGVFILHPQDSPEAKEEGWHAMVIVGYSEENEFYIIRNSWGPDFGEDGYCYIPMAYIDDPEYIDFACIITEISDAPNSNIEEVPSELANFAATETEIKIAAIRNAISKMRVELDGYKKLYSDYYNYYQRLMQFLSMPNVQNEIRASAEKAQAAHYIDVEAKKRELEDSFVNKLKEYKKYLIRTIIGLFVAFIGFGIGWYLSESHWIGIITLCFAGLGILTWSSYKWWVRIMRKRLQDELDEFYVDAKRQRQKLFEMQLKFHVSGIWIKRFHKISMELGSIYDRMVSYNEALRAWKKDYSSTIDKMNPVEGQMFRLLEPTSLLPHFFENHRKEIVSKIDLYKVFEDYQIDIRNLSTSHKNLCDSVKEAISLVMGDFNIVDYLMGETYPYLEPVNMADEFKALLAVGQPTYRNKAREATPRVSFLFANVPISRAEEWKQEVSHYFPMKPVHLHSNDSNSIIILTLHPVEEI